VDSFDVVEIVDEALLRAEIRVDSDHGLEEGNRQLYIIIPIASTEKPTASNFLHRELDVTCSGLIWRNRQSSIRSAKVRWIA
jgi:hypothetical protein